MAARALFGKDHVCPSRRRGIQRVMNAAGVAQPKHFPGTPIDLADAIARIARGDGPAFATLYAATSAKLYGIIIRIIGRRDVADDVLQEVYVRVWQRAGEFDAAKGSPITWLATIARNRALDEARRKTMRSFDEFPEVRQLPSADDPFANLERNEERRRLQTCLDRLEPEKRAIICLAYFYGMTREEIARKMGRPIPTVKTWLRRSLVQLKEHLGEPD